ncbi:MAG: hypothetical protein KDA91_20080 [Planctomycetaceae bacterium]|nr:hypothetical protein [Planctomycetaceae bacterium]
MKNLILVALVLASATTAFGQDYSNVRSGMLLGIYSQPCNGGLKITSIIEGYSAEGRLFPGDVLKRVTPDGNMIYTLRSLYEMENAKMAIGPNRQAAVEFYRPGVGLMYGWVEFTPIAGPAAVTSSGGSTKQYKAQFKLESEKPGARAMFKSNSNSSNGGIKLPVPPKFKQGGVSGGAKGLFGR